MGQHKVRRLPVIDGHELVGIVAVADVARSLPERPVGDLIEAISERSRPSRLSMIAAAGSPAGGDSRTPATRAGRSGWGEVSVRAL